MSKIETLNNKIEKAEMVVVTTKKKYDEALANLKKLLDKRDALRRDEIISAIAKSNKTYEEILMFLNGDMLETE